MAVPDYQQFMLPILKFCSDQEDHRIREVYDRMAEEMDLSDDDLKVLVPSGRQSKFENRVSWAKVYLKKAGLVDNPSRGIVKITQRGLDVLQQNPAKIDNDYLKKFPEFIEFKERRLNDSKDQSSTDEIEQKDDQITTIRGVGKWIPKDQK